MPLAYLAFGLLWIFGSDVALGWLFPDDPDALLRISTIKGVGFVALSSLWFYLAMVLTRHMRSTGGLPPRKLGFSFAPIAVFAGSALVVALIGVGLLQTHAEALREGRGRELAAVATLKATKVETWFDEQRRSLTFALQSQYIEQDIDEWMKSGDVQTENGLRARLESIRESGAYNSLAILDTDGIVRMTVGHRLLVEPWMLNELAAVISSRASWVGPIRIGGSIEDTGMTVETMVPIIDSLDPAERAIAVVIARTDPGRLLAGLVGAEPSLGHSGESALVYRDVSKVLMISPIVDGPLPAGGLEAEAGGPVGRSALSIADDERLLEGVDYSGDRALAVGRRVAHTNLFAVAKLDLTEAEAPQRRAATVAAAVLLAVLVLALATLALWWRLFQNSVAEMIKGIRSEIDLQREHFAMANRFSNDAVLLMDANRRILSANDRASEMYGLSLDELCHMKVDELREPGSEEASSASGQFKHAMTEGRLRFETIHRRRNGTLIPVEVSSRSFELGGQSFVQSIIRDVSERRQSERRLSESEGRLNFFIQQAPAALAMFDCEMRYLAASQRWLQDYSLVGRDLTGLSHYEVFPEIGERWKAAHRRGLAGEVVRKEDDRFERANGTVQWLRWEVWPWRDADGEVGGIVLFTEDITDLKDSEQSLALLVQRLQRAEANAGLGSWEFDLVSGQVWWSEEMYRLVDLDPSAGLPSLADGLDCLHPEDRPLLERALRQLQAGEQPEPAVCRTNPLRGPVRRLRPSVLCEPDAAGHPLRYVGTLLDTTEIDETRLQLERRTRLYDLLSQCNQAIVRVSDDASLFDAMVRLAVDRGGFLLAWIARLEPDGRVTAVASHGGDSGYVDSLAITGDRASLQGRGPTGTALREGREVISNDFLVDPRTARWHEAARQRGFMASGAFPIRTRGRVSHALNLYATDRGFFDQDIVETLKEVADDISHAIDGLLTRRDLDETRNLMQTLIDSSAALIFVSSRDGRFLMLNAACARAVGVPSEAIIGRRREDVMPAEIAAIHWANDQQVLLADGPRSFEEVNHEADGDHVYLSVKYPIRDASGYCYAIGCVSTDITALRLVQQELKDSNVMLETRVVERTRELAQARDAAQAADRAKSAFLTTMSHELRSPLNSIIGFTSVLLEELSGPLTAGQREQLGIVRDASRHLLAIINDLLDLSKIEAEAISIARAPYDLQVVIDRLIHRYSLLASARGLLLIQSGERGPLPMVGDARRAEQILSNLLSNAVKFTRQGKVTVSVEKGASEIRVAVRDTGPGIAEADWHRLFRPFSQLDAADDSITEGAGLGLAIALRLAEAMGGRLGLVSKPDMGSVFTLTLPVETV